MSFPRYPAYIDSGVQWIPALPAQWDLKRFKSIFAERIDKSESGDELLLSVSAYTGVTPRFELVDEGDHLSRAESLEGYKRCFKDDLVMNIMLAWNRGLAFTQFEGIVSPAYCVFKVIDGSHPGFLNYLVRSDDYTAYFKAFSSGVIDSRLRIYPETFGALFCALPPTNEQIAIATFLDRETAKIDALVAEQERLIALLQEKRQAVISHAVTKGLNPSAPMKDSGVQWLGEVPVHWEIKSISHILDAIGDVDHFMPESVEKGVPYLMTGDLKEFASEVDFDGCKQVSDEDYIGLSKRIKNSRGDVIMARYATIGTSMYVDIAFDFLVSYSCVTLKTDYSKMSGLYLFKYMKSIAFLQGIENKINANTQGNVGIKDLQSTKIAVPPIHEQTAIATFLDRETAKLDTLMTEARTAITLLQERRTALISAAVTGQIDVRAQAA